LTGPEGAAGGLVGVNAGSLFQVYSEAKVSAPKVQNWRTDWLELFKFDNFPKAIPPVRSRTEGREHVSGGLVGVDDATAGSVSSSYWDTTTSVSRIPHVARARKERSRHHWVEHGTTAVRLA